MVYIKNVIIHGFKSYRSMNPMPGFSEGYNVIVGQNGHGKSNFFDAIKFVLCDSDEYRPAEARKHLLHDGAGERAQSASVEIQFDNSQRRFPVDRDEVVLRREISLKDDQYTLDGRVVTRSDVQNLLESAGFSKSNPYYIVEQGRVAELATMKDARRLDLLKEIAGTSVYDERRAESVRVLADAEQKTRHVETLLSQMDAQLESKRREMEELQQFQRLDREHRSLLYAFYSKERVHAENKLERIDEARLEESARAKEYYRLAMAAHDDLKHADRSLKALSEQRAQYTDERVRTDAERTRALSALASAELRAADLRREASRRRERRRVLRREARTLLHDELAAVATERAGVVEPAHSRAVADDLEAREGLTAAEQQLASLLDRHGRAATFRTKEERDAWIRDELARLSQEEQALEASARQLAAELADVRAQANAHGQRESELRREVAQLRADAAELDRETQTRREEREDLEAQRRTLRRQDERLSVDIAREKDALLAGERELQSSIGSAFAAGLAAVRRIANELSLTGVYGPLIELVDVPDEFATAVEVAAGASLFYVVVDTDATAARILSVMQRESLPTRISFLPLNRLPPVSQSRVSLNFSASSSISATASSFAPTNELPINKDERAVGMGGSRVMEEEEGKKITGDEEDVLPLMDHVTYASVIEKAVAQVFGKIWVCRTLDLAASMARMHGVRCVTLEGDQVSRKGALTGGFHDPRRSRLAAMRVIRSSRSALEARADEARKCKAQLQALDQRLAVAVGVAAQLAGRQAQVARALEQAQWALRLHGQSDRTRTRLEARLSQLAEEEGRLSLTRAALSREQASLQRELGSELLSTLSDTERRSLAELRAVVETRTALCAQTLARRMELQAQRKQLRIRQAHLLRRLKELVDDYLANAPPLTSIPAPSSAASRSSSSTNQPMLTSPRILPAPEETSRELEQALEQIVQAEVEDEAVLAMEALERQMQQVLNVVVEKTPSPAITTTVSSKNTAKKRSAASKSTRIQEEGNQIEGGVHEEEEEEETVRKEFEKEEKEEELLLEQSMEIKQVARWKETVEQATQRLQELEAQLESCQQLEGPLAQRVDDLKAEEQAQLGRIQAESKRMEMLLNERHLVLQKKEDALRKIRELGSLPADALERFGELSTRELEGRIKATARELEAFDVNKKAAEQYLTHVQQHGRLKERRDELERSQQSIQNLILSLDLRKEEAIFRTYKGVAKRFSEVFEELVPSGVGCLAMQTDDAAADADGLPLGAHADAAMDTEQPPQPASAAGGIERYTGVTLKVSFTSNRLEDAQPLHSLSHGQKSLVALALIFAIQRCDPAPFYLFDEIDAALDPVHRSAVARLIARLSAPSPPPPSSSSHASSSSSPSSSTQFILTTFKPELVMGADRWFAIRFVDHVSTVQRVSRDQALRVLQENENARQHVVDSLQSDSPALDPTTTTPTRSKRPFPQ